MASSFLALFDDIASLLDDIAAMTKIAAKKTAGVLGDDLALNAEQVAGVRADRELPVIWAVAKGALVNKAILVPAAVAISVVAPWLIVPLLMIGGGYLGYEGFHKVWHKLVHREAERAHASEHVRRVSEAGIDLVAVEKQKVKGAIRTDFVLSAEIVVIALGSVAGEPILTQFAVLATVGIAMTVFVYGLVAAIVKLDDAGFALRRRGGMLARLGAVLVATAPVLMKGLTIVGTAAMFLVGGGIVAHGIHVIGDAIAAAAAAAGPLGMVVSLLLDALVGGATGALVAVAVAGVEKVRPRKEAPSEAA